MEHAENSELEIIKQFIARYGKLMLILFVLFVIAVLGGNYWQKSKIGYANNASNIFQDMVIADIQNDKETAMAKGEQLIMDYRYSPYAQFAGLLLAKLAVNEGNLDKAAEKLRWVIAQRGSQNIARHLATVRLSAVLLQQNKLDAALDLVAKDQDKAYITLYAQARGDVYLAKGEVDQAKNNYKLAMQSLPMGVQSPLLQMKLLDLGGDDEVASG